MESKDFEVANNYIDLADNKNQITFIADRKAQEILRQIMESHKLLKI
jgi:hypothetical protein